jgi:hypothetical protein
MKPILPLLFLALMLFSCQKANELQAYSSDYTTVLVDITDPLVAYPTADPILSLYDLGQYPGKEVSFRLTTITDKKLNAAMEFHLSNSKITEQNNRAGDSNYRDKLISIFYDSVRTALAVFRAEHAPALSLDNSECFSVIVSELNHLTKNRVAKKDLLVFSDLQENSDLFNCYVCTNQTLLKNDPEKLAIQLGNRLSLANDLTGITVYFIYNPVTREEDEKFHLMVEVYKYLLESRGAKVIVQAQNKYFN